MPGYPTSVRDGGFYGWPYSYYGQHVDDRVQPQQPRLVAKALSPDYAHGMVIGQHGSWNRKRRSAQESASQCFDTVFAPVKTLPGTDWWIDGLPRFPIGERSRPSEC